MHQLPDDQYQKLNAAATAAGYANVSAFIDALSQGEVYSKTLPLSADELAASLALIDKSISEFEAGGGLSLDEARQRTQQRLQQLVQ